jgi:hypothetical protein
LLDFITMDLIDGYFYILIEKNKILMMNKRVAHLNKTSSFDRDTMCHITKRGSSGVQLNQLIDDCQETY